MKRLAVAVLVGVVVASLAGASDLVREARRWTDILKWKGCISTIASRDGASVEIRDYDGNGIADIVVRARRIKSREETLRCIASAVAGQTSHATWRPDKVVVFVYGLGYEGTVKSVATVTTVRKRKANKQGRSVLGKDGDSRSEGEYIKQKGEEK